MNLAQADREAAEALAKVDASAASQLRVLQALQQLIELAGPDGVVGAAVARFREDRHVAFVRFHERTLASADNGDLDDDARAYAYDEAVAYTVGVAGDGVEAAALRERRGRPGSERHQVPVTTGGAAEAAAVPFFARFLEHQKR